MAEQVFQHSQEVYKMIQGHVFLVLLLMLIGATVLWVFISSANTRWIFKAGLTTLMLFAILSAWIGLRSIYGYPYDEWPNKEKYILVGSYVEEPEIKEPDSGAIYLWLIDNNREIKQESWIDVISSAINGRQPRVFVIQYTRQMHEELSKLEKQRQGKPIPIELVSKEKAEDLQSRDGEGEDRQVFEPYILPDAIVIAK